MILGFKKNFPDGTPTNFKSKIANGTMLNPTAPNFWLHLPEGFLYKIHSMREDQNDRWQAGKTIQMAYGVRTKQYEQFNKGIEELEKCVSTQEVFMVYDSDIKINVDGKHLNATEIEMLIKNDGLTRTQFLDWFFPKDVFVWSGKIIHWTNFRY